MALLPECYITLTLQCFPDLTNLDKYCMTAVYTEKSGSSITIAFQCAMELVLFGSVGYLSTHRL